MRFYELMSGQTKPLFVPLEGPDGLRERFYLQGSMKSKRLSQKYRCSQKELDESSPYSFVAKEEKLEKIIGWTFFPVFMKQRRPCAAGTSAHG